MIPAGQPASRSRRTGWDAAPPARADAGRSATQLIVARPRDGAPVVMAATAALVWRPLEDWTTPAEIDRRLGEAFPEIADEDRVAARTEILRDAARTTISLNDADQRAALLRVVVGRPGPVGPRLRQLGPVGVASRAVNASSRCSTSSSTPSRPTSPTSSAKEIAQLQGATLSRCVQLEHHLIVVARLLADARDPVRGAQGRRDRPPRLPGSVVARVQRHRPADRSGRPDRGHRSCSSLKGGCRATPCPAATTSSPTR